MIRACQKTIAIGIIMLQNTEYVYRANLQISNWPVLGIKPGTDYSTKARADMLVKINI